MEKKKSKLSKLYFWLFVTLAIMAAFLLWSARGDAFINDKSGVNSSYVAAIIAILLSLMFGFFTFVRFIRSRSVAGGLFLTTSISTGIFLGSSQIIAAVIPPTAAAYTNNAEAVNSGYTAIVSLAQIGLFALWFLFLLMTIFIQVSPVKKIDKVLSKIIEGDDVKRVHIGKSKQYCCIAEKLQIISSDVKTRRQKEEHKKAQNTKQRIQAKQRAEERKRKLEEIEKHQAQAEAAAVS